MQIVIAAVGKAKKKTEAELVAHYLKQTRWDIVVKEIPDAPENLSSEARLLREAEKFQPLLGACSRLIAMDSRGKSISSPEFAALIQRAQGDSVKRLVIAIGGQDGLAPEILASAKHTIAFGAATWPHQLLRAMLAEQLYRSYTITIGHPYHRGH